MRMFFVFCVSLMFVVVGSVGVSAEGIDSDTMLMLHMDDTGLTDDSTSSHSITLSGGVTRSATQSKFGDYSAYFDGTGDYLTITDSNEFSFGTGNFTIDFWMHPTVYTSWCQIFFMDAPEAIQILYHNTLPTYGNCFQIEAPNVYTCSGTMDTPINSWHHYALVRDGNYVRQYVDGIETVNRDIGVTPLSDPTTITIGKSGSGWDNNFQGYIDEFRISKGVARWASNFTPPTSAYTSGLGNITAYWVTPVTDVNVQQNTFTKFQVGVNCSGGPCGDVNVTLDPKEVKKAISEYQATHNSVEEEKDVKEKSWLEEIVDFVKGVFRG